jgi:hypothetical protein
MKAVTWHGKTKFFERAGMEDTKLGQARRTTPPTWRARGSRR